MTHIAVPHIIDVVGTFAGVLGIAIALYLRFVSDRRVPVKYEASFFVLGAGMWLLHLDPFMQNTQGLIVARTIGYLLLIGGQLYAAHRVVEDAPFEASDMATAQVHLRWP